MTLVDQTPPAITCPLPVSLIGTFTTHQLCTGGPNAGQPCVTDADCGPGGVCTTSVTCDELDVPWDDHLSEVRVPLFYVGAAGGFGTVGEYVTQIVGTRDVTSLIVRERPPEEVTLDVGHNDIFLSAAARKLFWEPMLAWIRAH